jgi:hypothetical protein
MMPTDTFNPAPARRERCGCARQPGDEDNLLCVYCKAAAGIATMQQPPPSPASGDIWLDVIELMHHRRLLGIKRYGTPLQAHNGRDALVDARDEALDMVAYLTQAIKERDIALAALEKKE